MEGGAEARLQALRKRHKKPTTKLMLRRVRQHMRNCAEWEKPDLCKVRALRCASWHVCLLRELAA